MNFQIFKFESDESSAFNQVRTIIEDGKVWFSATDVARVLGYANPQKAIRDHCKTEGVNELFIPTTNQWGTIVNQKIKFITEGNVYRLIVSSKLPSAERFEKWLFDEVIPSIRQKGYYGITDRSVLPNFVIRYKDNVHLIPHNYFSVITELYVRLYAMLEKVGYSIPDKAPDGKSICVDISVGKYFSKYLKEIDSELWNKHKTYKHHYPDGRMVDAYMYPIEALPLFINYVSERWIFEHAEEYFKKRDPLALDYLPKLIEAQRKSA
jgi:prophage antirepressor-like protein